MLIWLNPFIALALAGWMFYAAVWMNGPLIFCIPAGIAFLINAVLGPQSTLLLSKEDWQPDDVEEVSIQVLDLLIRHGWKRSP